ncbi:MAG: phosphohistidine phosphatase SixA [Oscillatoriales cyanobacterium SM2_2_1]|nr:phosphohistidine phosphatase SixA [Oscillatoriales cyanobacterium SM2_2_1]
MTSLYLIRHGVAIEPDPQVPDEGRSLTAEGRRKTQRVAQRLQKLGLVISLIHTSPLARAQETAAIFSETFNCGMAEEALLAPGGDLGQWLTWFGPWQLEHGGKQKAIALIGHEPDLTAWAEQLLWGEVRSVLVLKKVGIIGVTVPDREPFMGQGLLFLLAPPKMFGDV